MRSCSYCGGVGEGHTRFCIFYSEPTIRETKPESHEDFIKRVENILTKGE